MSDSPRNGLCKVVSVAKEFSGVRVLDDVSFELQRGEVFGIIGENGAGKSTLMKIISGIYSATEGEIYLEGEKTEIRSPSDAKRLGITMIPQEFNLVGTLRVFENIFLGAEPKQGLFLDKRHMREKAREYLERLDKKISPDAMIDSLSVAQKQMVEIAKALVHDSKILVMDEPTTMLTDHEIDVLFDLIRSLKEHEVTVVFISHKLKEVSRITDRVLILRDGKLITLSPTAELSEHEMARRMVGRELNQMYPDKAAPAEEIVFEVEGLTVEGIVEDASFNLKKGEVLGFAGLVGAGRTEAAEAIVGLRRKNRGTIRLGGTEIEIGSLREAVNHGIGYLSEDRLGKGIVLGFNIPSNVTLISLDKYAKLLIDDTKAWQSAEKYIDTFDIRAASLAYQLRFLSGGNQQKVYLAKWMDTDPKILILDEPTRGVDVNAKAELYRFIHSLTDQGISCIMISSEMEEIIGMANRVYVMAEGRITGELSGDEITEQQIMYHAAELIEEQR